MRRVACKDHRLGEAEHTKRGYLAEGDGNSNSTARALDGVHGNE